MARFVMFASLGSVILFLLTLVVPPSAQAQANALATPIPGSGHDYIHMLNETVDPASGSVSLRMQVPVPPGRGLNLPFAFTYDSNEVHFMKGTGVPGYGGWSTRGGYLASGGWSYSVPMFSNIIFTKTFDGGKYTCTYLTSYVFQDPDGAQHMFPMAKVGGAINVCPQSYSSGADPVYQAYGINAPPIVAGPDGTTFQFGNPSRVGTDNSVSVYLASALEDRNGNKITLTDLGSGAFKATDTAGRTAFASSGFGSTGNTVTVSGFSVPYSLTWGKATSNFSVVATGGPSDTCFLATVENETQSVVTAITLPNQKQYRFSYDPTYGEVSKITYPSGGYVSYTWGVNPLSADVSFGASSGIGSCIYTYGKPAIIDRYVSFDGQTQALHQHFQYSTASDFSSKQTIVTTYDLVRGVSYETDYTYTPTQGLRPSYVGGYYDNRIYVEDTVIHKDSKGATLRTVNKTWRNVYQLQSEQVILDSGQSVQTTFTYDAGDQLHEKDEYDYGQTSPTRKTIINHQSLLATPIFPSAPSILDRPCQMIVYDGNNNAYAETDYFYDGGSTELCVAAQVQ